MNASFVSRIDDEVSANASGGTYSIHLHYKPHRLDDERKRALAQVIRQKTRELSTLVGMLVEGTEVSLTVSSTSQGIKKCDMHEALDGDEV
jgi:hypothetical protein